MAHLTRARRASEGTRYVPRLRVGLVSLPTAGSAQVVFLAVAAWLWTPLPGAGAAVPDALPALGQAVPADGEPFAAAIAAIDTDWNVTFCSGAQKRVLAARDLVHWGAYRDTDDSTWVVLSDGGVLAAEVLQLREERLELHSRLWGAVQLPLARVRGIVFDPPLDPRLRDRLLSRLLSAEGGQDQLWLDNGDIASGTIQGIRPADGPAGELVVAFSAQGRELALPIEQLDALAFNPALIDAAKPRGPHAWLGFRDGSLLCVTQVASQDKTTELRLGGTVLLKAETERGLEAATYLRPVAERIVYLSDLKPAGYRHVPLIETEWPLGTDRSAAGGRLRVGGVIHDKGLGMHSTSRVAYDLDGAYRRFAAALAIDDTAGLAGSVTFRVFLGDAAGTWKQVYESPTVRGGAAPVAVSLDASGARRLALIVDFADRGDTQDHADWLDARLIR